MMKKLLILVSMVVMFLLIVSCAPKMSDEELEAELGKLSPEELEAVTAEDDGALAGQASARLTDPNLIKLKKAYTYRKTRTVNPAKCGNGIKEGTEQCDDGNTANDDSCTTTCTSTGNKAALIIIAESVEYSLDSTNQNVKVTATVKNLGNAATGNGFGVGFTQLEVYGQPVTNQPAPALAVDESATVSVTLNAHCPSPAPGGHSISIFADSGNKVVETSKADNWHSLTYTCGKVCLEPNGCVCGDGLKNSTEQCDDGNTVSGDGCSAMCKLEFCGNGFMNPEEECDDGNTVSLDGCTAYCKLETGWICTPPIPSGQPCVKEEQPAPAPNNNPTIQVSDVTGEQGSYPSFTIQASDPDGDTLTFSKSLGVGINDADFVLNANTGFTGWHIPLGQAPGEYTVKYLVSDGKGGEASAEAKFTVTAASSY